MRKLRLLTLTILLATFSVSTAMAQQGNNDCIPGNTQSPPCVAAAQSLPPDQESTDQTVSTVTTQATNSTDVLAEVTVDLIQVVLAIF